MVAVGRWYMLFFVLGISLVVCHATARSVGGSNQRVPSRWIEPMPHIPGDDPDLHGMGLFVPDSIQIYWRTHATHDAHSAAILPDAIDWSAYDSPVKAQGCCGACWAFAAVAAIENAGQQNDLSEQVIISCAGAGSCSGGYYETALNYMHSIGIPPEVAYPYNETNGDCSVKSASPPYLERIRSMTTSMWGEVAELGGLKNALQSGPVLIRLVVFSDFSAYKSGIYHHSDGTFKGFHALLVVGYNDSLRCFKAKNSWGVAWGEGGYCRVSYDDLNNDVEFGGYGAQVSGAYSESLTAGITEQAQPQGFRLDQNWPNPFNPRTIVSSQLPVASDVRMVVYDALGRQVAVLVDQRRSAGKYQDVFDASNLSSGYYFCRLNAGSYVEIKKMLLLR